MVANTLLFINAVCIYNGNFPFWIAFIFSMILTSWACRILLIFIPVINVHHSMKQRIQVLSNKDCFNHFSLFIIILTLHNSIASEFLLIKMVLPLVILNMSISELVVLSSKYWKQWWNTLMFPLIRQRQLFLIGFGWIGIHLLLIILLVIY